jgi:hypothetical protein
MDSGNAALVASYAARSRLANMLYEALFVIARFHDPTMSCGVLAFPNSCSPRIRASE